jgi:hypothetical protein
MSMNPPINTVALARWKMCQLASLAVSTAWSYDEKPLKRSAVPSSDPHRAKATVLMGGDR